MISSTDLLNNHDNFKPCQKINIAIIGLGYVGLPLAIEFAKKYIVLGFDTDRKRVDELLAGNDKTKQVNRDNLRVAGYSLQNNSTVGLKFSSDVNELHNSNVYIVTVPTPVDEFKSPDISSLLEASAMLSSVLQPNDVVIYESTVYPGCTEEDCVPVLESVSGLKFNKDFFVGYSPERINPGDKINTLTKIKKVTSGSTPKAADFVNELYASIITAGTHKTSSIKIAEASKAVENSQRDVNISFINEIALIFDRMGIDTQDVLDAAATKWNFIKFKPGLVGGHCIGVDPYYLAHKAESLGYHPQVILSGRKVNDAIGIFIANKVLKLLITKGNDIVNARALILGIAFKENSSDTRNTRVVDIYKELKDFGIEVDVYDPWANAENVKNEYDIDMIDSVVATYDAIILAVAHNEFLKLDFSKIVKGKKSVIYDTKSFLDRKIVDARL